MPMPNTCINEMLETPEKPVTNDKMVAIERMPELIIDNINLGITWEEWNEPLFSTNLLERTWRKGVLQLAKNLNVRVRQHVRPCGQVLTRLHPQALQTDYGIVHSFRIAFMCLLPELIGSAPSLRALGPFLPLLHPLHIPTQNNNIAWNECKPIR